MAKTILQIQQMIDDEVDIRYVVNEIADYLQGSSGGLTTGATWVSGSVQTTGNMPTTLLTIAVPLNKTINFIGVITGREITGTVGDSRTAGILMRAKNVSGVVTSVGATPSQLLGVIADSSAGSLIFAGAISGSNLLAQVTGLAATIVDWTISGYYIITP